MIDAPCRYPAHNSGWQLTNAAHFEAELWNFSLDRYGRSGIREICLELQDEFGADVNVVLLCLWAGQVGFSLTGSDIQNVMSAGAADWHANVVVPLRMARRNAKTLNCIFNDAEIETFRDKVKTLELEAEKQAQRLLACALAEHYNADDITTGATGSSTALATRNLSNYLAIVAPLEATTWRDHATALVSVCID